MPVYYDEKDERKEFIKNTINNLPVAVDTGCFASYLYKDVGYENLKLEYAEYDKMMEIITNRFPRLDRVQVLKEVFSTIVDVEQEYIKVWMSKENPSLTEVLEEYHDPHDYSFMKQFVHPNWSDC
jgi:hypothetical protein